NPEVAGSNPAPAIPAPHVDAGFLSAARPRARTKEPWRDRSRGRRPGSAVPSATSQAADVTGGLDWLNDSSGVQTGQVAQLVGNTNENRGVGSAILPLAMRQ